MVLNFVIVGHEDHPIFEADLSARDSAAKEDRAQYLHQVITVSTIAIADLYKDTVKDRQSAQGGLSRALRGKLAGS